MLNLVTGDFPRLERALSEELGAICGRADGTLRRAAVVAPSRAMIRHLERALATRAEGALAGVSFHTFQSLARDILLDSGVPREAMAEDNLVDSKFLEVFIEQGAAEGLGKAGFPAPGIVSSLLGSVRDLEEAAVNPAEFPAELLDKEAPETEELKRLLVFASGLREKRRERGLLGRTDVVTGAARAAGDSRLVKSFERFFYYGSYDLTQHQLDFLFALGEAAEVVVMVPVPAADKGGVHQAYRFAEPTISLISRKAGPSRALPPAWDGALGGLAGALMAPGAAGVVRDSSRVEFWKALGARDEFELAAAEAWRLMRDQGVKPHEILIAARSLEGRLPEAAAAFDSARLPWTSAAGTPICDMEAGRGLLMLARALTGDVGPEAVLSVCGVPWLKASTEVPSLSRASALCARLPAHAGEEEWKRLAAAEGPRGEADRRTLETLRDAALRLARMANTFPEKGAWGAFSDRFLALLEELSKREELPAGSAAERVYEAFVSAADGLRNLDKSGENADRETFFKALEEACRNSKVRLHERKGGVELLDVMDARGRSPRALFLLGMNEDEFPRAMSEDPFLKDSVRKVLGEVAGYKIQQKLMEGLEEERLLFHMAVSSARERLYLLWHAFDERGRPALPSGFLHELLGAAKPGEEPETVPVKRGRKPVSARVVPAAAGLYSSAVKIMEEIDDEDGMAGKRDGFAGGPLDWSKGLAVTGLETAAKCPFRAFAGILLGIEPPRRPRSPWEPEPAKMGNAVHAVMEDLAREYAGRWKRESAAAIAKSGREKLDRAFGDALPELSAFPVLRASLLEELGDLIGEMVEKDAAFCEEAGWIPSEFEKRVEGAAGGKGPALRGKIDRVDSGPAGSRYLDYKTHYGRETVDEKARFTPDFFQLGLYANTVEKRINDVFISVLHLGSGIGGVVMQNADQAASAAMIGRSAGLARKMTEKLAEGSVFPMPDELGPPRGAWAAGCGTCEYSLVCRKDHEPTLKRLAESGDPAELGADTSTADLGSAGNGGPRGGEEES